MEPKDAATLRIRKLRKKLRQIEHLEGLDRDLTDEELSKCIKKDPIREELQDLLSEFGNASTVSSTLSAVNSSGVSWSNVSADSSVQSSLPRLEDDIQTSLSHFEEQEIIETEETQSRRNKINDASENNEDKEDEAWHTVTSKHHMQETVTSKHHTQETNTNNSSMQESNTNNSSTADPRAMEDTKEKRAQQISKSSVIQRNPSPERDKTVFKAPLPSPPKKSKKTSKARFVSDQVRNPEDRFSHNEAHIMTDNGPVENPVVKQWRSSGFLVTALESHNDIVTAVDCDDSLIISASRDTTVKVWDEATLTELRSLGGHTGSVTDVILLSPKQYGSLGEKLGLGDDKLILSSSTDCSIKVWSASTGELLKSIYTYNPVTKLAFHEGLSLVVSTSDGGKLELWDLVTKETVCSVLAHDNAITALCHDGKRIYTASADGEIKIHEIREHSLNCVYVSENVRSLTGHTVSLRGIKALVVKGDQLFCGDDGVNIKILDWKKGVVKKLANHKEDYGMTDTLCCHGDVLYSSAYDLDIGQGYINVMDVSTTPCYITSIEDDDTGRIFDIACCEPGPRAVTIVTAGIELKVWKQVPSSSDFETIVPTKVIPRLSQFAVDSDIESDAEFTDTDSEDGAYDNRGGKYNVDQTRSWRNWCNLM